MKAMSGSSWVDSLGVAVFLEKMGQIAQFVGEKASHRLQKASEAFGAKYDLEMKIQAAEIPLASCPAQLRLAGFLVSESKAQWLPLYEGKNHYSIRESASGKQLSIIPGTSEDEAADILVAHETDLELQAGDQRSRIATNQKIPLGGEGFVVKLLPVSQRCDVIYRSEVSR